MLCTFSQLDLNCTTSIQDPRKETPCANKNLNFFQLASSGLSHQQRKELMEKGPFNLVFHGIKPDWIEEEMDDDPEFKRDVLEQKIRNIIRQEVTY